MKKLLLSLPIALLFSCGGNSSKPETQTVVSGNALLQPDGIQQRVTQNHEAIKNTKATFANFKTYIATLPPDSITTIPFALDYIITCTQPNTPDADSILYHFSNLFYNVITKQNEVVSTRYKTVMDAIGKDSATNQTTIFKSNLAACGITMASAEGEYFLAADSNYFFANFSSRVSPSAKQYLLITRIEMAKSYYDDGALIIPYSDIYQRAKLWENFKTTYPASPYAYEAGKSYMAYMQALMLGLDNTPAFDMSTHVLDPKVKSLYEKIIAANDLQSSITKTISAYYNFLSRHNFTNNDSVNYFLQAQNLVDTTNTQGMQSQKD